MASSRRGAHSRQISRTNASTEVLPLVPVTATPDPAAAKKPRRHHHARAARMACDNRHMAPPSPGKTAPRRHCRSRE